MGETWPSAFCHYLHLATCSINYVFFVLSGPLRGTPNKIAYGRFPSLVITKQAWELSLTREMYFLHQHSCCVMHGVGGGGIWPVCGLESDSATIKTLQTFAPQLGSSTQSCSYDTMVTTCTMWTWTRRVSSFRSSGHRNAETGLLLEEEISSR